jgi:hypothetical protein
MRARVVAVVLLGPSSVAMSAAADPVAVAPTAFEAFLAEPSTDVAAAREVGSLASVDSTVKLTILVAAARADDSRRMRGVRVELSNNGGAEPIYLDEPQLERLLLELDMMELAKDKAFGQAQGAAPGGMSVLGTESCWMPNPVQRILCPELQRAATWSGLRLWTFGGAVFDFRDRDSAELRELVERAAAELRKL